MKLQNYLSVVFFCYVFGSLGHFWLYVELKYNYSKKQSVTEKDMRDLIYQIIYISLWFYGWGFGCQNLLKMTTFRSNMRILCHNANLLELLNPEMVGPDPVLQHILKLKKDNKSPWPSEYIFYWLVRPYLLLKNTFCGCSLLNFQSRMYMT